MAPDHWSLVSIQSCNILQPLIINCTILILSSSLCPSVAFCSPVWRVFKYFLTPFWSHTRLGGLGEVFLDLDDFPKPSSGSKLKSLLSLIPPRTWTQYKGMRQSTEPSRPCFSSSFSSYPSPPVLRRSLSTCVGVEEFCRKTSSA